MQMNIALSNNFTDASYGRAKNAVFSSLRSDAERFVSDIQTAPGGTEISPENMLHEAWQRARQAAREEGRTPRRAEVQANLHTLRDEGIRGYRI